MLDMSAVDEVTLLIDLNSMSNRDSVEISASRDVIRFLDAAQSSVEACLTNMGMANMGMANMGMEGEAEASAKTKALEIVNEIESLKIQLSVWSDANVRARRVMREASHASEFEAAWTPRPPSNSPTNASAQATAAAASQMRAQVILDQMNESVEAPIPIWRNPRAASRAGESARRAQVQSPDSSVWGALAGSVDTLPPLSDPEEDVW